MLAIREQIEWQEGRRSFKADAYWRQRCLKAESQCGTISASIETSKSNQEVLQSLRDLIASEDSSVPSTINTDDRGVVDGKDYASTLKLVSRLCSLRKVVQNDQTSDLPNTLEQFAAACRGFCRYCDTVFSVTSTRHDTDVHTQAHGHAWQHKMSLRAIEILAVCYRALHKRHLEGNESGLRRAKQDVTEVFWHCMCILTQTTCSLKSRVLSVNDSIQATQTPETASMTERAAHILSHMLYRFLHSTAQATPKYVEQLREQFLVLLIKRASDLVKLQLCHSHGSFTSSHDINNAAAIEARFLKPLIAWLVRDSSNKRASQSDQGLSQEAGRRYQALLWCSILGSECEPLVPEPLELPDVPTWQQVRDAAAANADVEEDRWLLQELEGLLGIDLALEGI